MLRGCFNFILAGGFNVNFSLATIIAICVALFVLFLGTMWLISTFTYPKTITKNSKKLY